MHFAKSCAQWQKLTGMRRVAVCCVRLLLLASSLGMCQELLSLFKTDVNAAFRRVPIKESDRKYGHVVFMYEVSVMF